MGRRSTPYPARIKRPSGGTKLRSPGRSLHLASRTLGWNTGRFIFCPIACCPPGVVNDRSRSGTPDILAVNAIVPETSAERRRPEGAIVTESDSTISTYISLDVCRTLGLLHKIAGPWEAADDSGGFRELGPPNDGAEDDDLKQQPVSIQLFYPAA